MYVCCTAYCVLSWRLQVLNQANPTEFLHLVTVTISCSSQCYGGTIESHLLKCMANHLSFSETGGLPWSPWLTLLASRLVPLVALSLLLPKCRLPQGFALAISSHLAGSMKVHTLVLWLPYPASCSSLTNGHVSILLKVNTYHTNRGQEECWD